MRRAVTPAIPPSLYRHFAIVTVAVAAGLALFAEGEDGEARAAQVAQAQPVERPAPPVIARAAPTTATSGGWDEVDLDTSFGAPMDAPSDGSGQNSDFDEDSAPAPGGPATLSTIEREVLLRGLQAHAAPSPDG